MKTVNRILGENKTSKYEATLELMRQLRELQSTCKERPAKETAQIALKIVSKYRKTLGISYKSDTVGLDITINQTFFWLQDPKPNFVLRKSYWEGLLEEIATRLFNGIRKGQIQVPYDLTLTLALGGDIMNDPDYTHYIPLVIKDIADAAYGGKTKPVQKIWLTYKKVIDDIANGHLQHLLPPVQ